MKAFMAMRWVLFHLVSHTLSLRMPLCGGFDLESSSCVAGHHWPVSYLCPLGSPEIVNLVLKIKVSLKDISTVKRKNTFQWLDPANALFSYSVLQSSTLVSDLTVLWGTPQLSLESD